MRPVATLPPIHPNLGLEAAYRKRLERMIAEMDASIVYFLKAAWRANPPKMAQDDLGMSPARALQAAMRRLGARWQKRFDELAPELARYFATASAKRVDSALAAALRKAGFTVRFTMTRKVNDVVQASMAQQVALIKSIPAQYLTQVQGSVMRSVQTGRDLGSLAKELEAHYGVTKRRAAFIATSQNNIATATITRARQAELGITEAKWLHSGGGRHPRPEHVAFAAGRNGGPIYDLSKGAFLEGKWTWPGVEPNCRCVARSIIPGLARAA